MGYRVTMQRIRGVSFFGLTCFATVFLVAACSQKTEPGSTEPGVDIASSVSALGDGSSGNPFTSLTELNGVPTGEYYVQIGSGPSVVAQVDNASGGGWLQVLNYVHQGGTNPSLSVLSGTYPTLSSSNLGDDESGTSHWGHVGNSWMDILGPAEFRFYGRNATSTIHFTTKDIGVLGYLTTGDGTMQWAIRDGDYTTEADHTAGIPASANNGFRDRGDEAMTNFPFYEGGARHWGIQGNGNRWEVDDYPNGSGNDTIHRLWVRRQCTENYGAKVPLTNADADHSQTNWPASAALDGDYSGNQAGWAISPQQGMDHQLSVQTVSNLGVDGVPMTLQIRMYHNYKSTSNSNRELSIGMFRLSYTTSDRATFGQGLDPVGTAAWTVLTTSGVTPDITHMESARASTFSPQPTHEVFVSGGQSLAGATSDPDDDTYFIMATFTPSAPITGFLLEALANAALPGNGPGRGVNGNIVLHEFEVRDVPCGDGCVDPDETCDDGNLSGGDGCDNICAVETGWQCTGTPSVCTEICGDGIVVGAEVCDDNNTAAGDGCSSTCTLETGFTCMGAPSTCTAICGDGLVKGSEGCDDGGTAVGDGCSATCAVETGYGCMGEPSTCSTVCGDGILAGTEACDDSGTMAGDGCSATCTLEAGFSCMGMPSMCTEICGDGMVVGSEGCDDGGTAPGDGCSATCTVEMGYMCAGAPSMCMMIGGGDAGMGDGGMSDGGMGDAGMSDGGVADSGMTDSGMGDGGSDAGVGDGGVVADGGLSDGGVVADGGLSDGGAVADGNVDTGVDPGTGGSSGGGCGCSVGDTRPAHREMLGAALLMLGVGFGLRRRRRR